jgi:hypothetical protein
VSKSFSIDLKSYNLCRAIGSQQTILQRTVGAYDVAHALSKLGYSNVDSFSEVVPHQFGTIFSLDTELEKATLGIPSTAVVSLRRLGGQRSKLLLTFTY